VLTVRSVPAGSSAPPVQVAHILVAVDFSDCSLEALEHTVQAAKEFGASVTILHVVEPASYGLDFALVCAGEAERTRASIEERLDQFAQVFREQGLAAEARLQCGVPAEEIVAFARKSGVDLIVMGTHGRRGFSHLVSGSVAEAVLRQAFCPVVTVKSPRYRPGLTRTMLPEAERACG
jgi:nucleotide-binding universal stress UspA family protein